MKSSVFICVHERRDEAEQQEVCQHEHRATQDASDHQNVTFQDGKLSPGAGARPIPAPPATPPRCHRQAQTERGLTVCDREAGSDPSGSV